MKRSKKLSIAIILIIIISAGATISYTALSKKSETKPIYVGVTYGGNNFEDAKILIDKVKNYTNLFVIQSGALMSNWSAMEQICDYAVNNNLKPNRLLRQRRHPKHLQNLPRRSPPTMGQSPAGRVLQR